MFFGSIGHGTKNGFPRKYLRVFFVSFSTYFKSLNCHESLVFRVDANTRETLLKS